VTVALTDSDSVRVARGAVSIPLLDLRLDNPGITGISSDVRIYSLALSLLDLTGNAVPNPAALLKQLRVRAGTQVVSTRPVLAGGGSVLSIPFSPPLNVPANSPLDVMVEGDLADTANYGVFQAQLADTTLFDARDATTRDRIPAEYAEPAIAGGWVRVEAAAESLVAGGSPLFPPSVLIGATDVPALSVTLRNPGAAGTARVRCDSLRLDRRDEAHHPLPPGSRFARLAVSWNGVVVSVAANPPGGGSVTFAMPQLLLAPSDSATVMVTVDVNPAAPAGSVELMLPADGIAAVDANSGRSVRVGAATGHELPAPSGPVRLQSPARSLSVGFASRIAAAFAADGQSLTAAVLALSNLDAAGAGAIHIDHLTLRAADRSFAPLAIGTGASRIEAWVGGVRWAASAALAPDSATASVLSSSPLSIAPGETTLVELRVVTRSDGGPSGFRLGVDHPGIGVVQPSSALLAVSIQPAAGQAFPMWSDAAGLSASTLRDSYSNFPNPFAAGRQATTFVYYLPAGARVSIRILTPRGESVATLLENEPRAVGLHQNDSWDGRNGRGQPVYNGIYVAELEVRYDDGTSDRLLRKLAVVR
jgi:hypothetical protein